MILKINSIVVLTGAGCSAESGLKTFRDNDGMWEEHRVEEVATPEAFHANPELVYRFYNARRKQLLSDDVYPNAAHKAIAELENNFNGDFLLVTQNVDNLHERAGSKKLFHMHGDLLTARCTKTHQVFEAHYQYDGKTPCQCCEPPSSIRPNIVWFGEMPLYMDEIYEKLWNTDLFISIGTSGNVYPAAGFVQEANRNGAHSVELNLEPSMGESAFAEKHYGPASQIVTEYVSRLLEDLC